MFIQPDNNIFNRGGITNTGKKYFCIFKIRTDINRRYGHHAERMVLNVPLYQAGQFSLYKVSNPAAAAEFFSHGLVSNGACHLDTFEYFDLITWAYIIVILDADTAFSTGFHFVHIVLEAAQGFQFTFINHYIVA